MSGEPIDLTTYDFKYMRPPKEVFQIKHDRIKSNYILRGDGYKLIRKIFYKVEFTAFEKEKIREFRDLIISEGVKIPDNWTDSEVLKYALSGRFVLPKSLGVLKKYLQWRSEKNPNVLSPGGLEMLKQGVVYLSGRDRMFRPIITMNVYKIDLKKSKIEDFVDALVFVLNLGKDYCFVPHYVENYIIIIETNDMGFFSFPFDVLKKILEVTTANYQSTLEKLYIMNPSFIMAASWNIIKGWLDPDTASKINMLKKADYDKLFEKVDPSQMEKKYGGTLPDPTKFWPPFTTLNEPPYTDLDLADMNASAKKGSRRVSNVAIRKGISIQSNDEESKSNTSIYTQYYDFETINFHNPGDSDNVMILTDFPEDNKAPSGYHSKNMPDKIGSGEKSRLPLHVVEEGYEENERDSMITPASRYKRTRDSTNITVESKGIKGKYCGLCRLNSDLSNRDDEHEENSTCSIF